MPATNSHTPQINTERANREVSCALLMSIPMRSKLSESSLVLERESKAAMDETGISFR
jgi:hypothetical protein